jgi:hypothetical protein
MASLSGYDSLHLPWHGFVEAKEVVWSYAISDFAHNFSDTSQKLVVCQRAVFHMKSCKIVRSVHFFMRILKMASEDISVKILAYRTRFMWSIFYKPKI